MAARPPLSAATGTWPRSRARRSSSRLCSHRGRCHRSRRAGASARSTLSRPWHAPAGSRGKREADGAQGRRAARYADCSRGRGVCPARRACRTHAGRCSRDRRGRRIPAPRVWGRRDRGDPKRSTVTRVSTMGLAQRPGTEVLPNNPLDADREGGDGGLNARSLLFEEHGPLRVVVYDHDRITRLGCAHGSLPWRVRERINIIRRSRCVKWSSSSASSWDASSAILARLLITTTAPRDA